MKSKFGEAIHNLILPEYFIITIFTIIAFGILIGYFNLNLIIPILILSFVMIGLNVLNNIFDINIDRINKPRRPLVTGVISRKIALLISSSAFLLGLLISTSISLNATALTITIIFLAILYSVPPIRAKRFILGANIIGGIIYGAFPYLLVSFIATAVPDPKYVLFFFLLIFSMAPIKDIEDIKGEKKFHMKSLATIFGKKKTRIIAMLLMIFTNILMILFVMAGLFKFNFLLAPIVSILLIFILYLIIRRSVENEHSIKTQSIAVTYTMLFVVIIEFVYATTMFLL